MAKLNEGTRKAFLRGARFCSWSSTFFLALVVIFWGAGIITQNPDYYLSTLIALAVATVFSITAAVTRAAIEVSVGVQIGDKVKAPEELWEVTDIWERDGVWFLSLEPDLLMTHQPWNRCEVVLRQDKG